MRVVLYILGLLLLITALLCTACARPRLPDVVSNVEMILTLPTEVGEGRINVDIVLTNKNSREVIKISSVETMRARHTILRGLYLVQVDGVFLPSGAGPVRVRGYVESVQFTEAEGQLTIPLTLLR